MGPNEEVDALNFCGFCVRSAKEQGITPRSGMSGAITMAAIIALQVGKDRESFLRLCGAFYDVARMAQDSDPGRPS